MKHNKRSLYKILVVDDEPSICKFLEIELTAQKYSMIIAENGQKGIAKVLTEDPDLVILDIGLPDINGQVVLKKIRQKYRNPVIILSALNEEADIVKALDSGANDYLVKPFKTGELLARIRTCLRYGVKSQSSQIFQYPGLEIDLSTRSVTKGGQYLKLTVTQYDLLVLFCKNEGKVLTHHHILKEVWGEDHVTQLEYLRVFVAQLRKKIEDETTGMRRIFTESGIGYRFVGSQQ